MHYFLTRRAVFSLASAVFLSFRSVYKCAVHCDQLEQEKELTVRL